MMPPLASFGISIVLSFIAWGIVLARYLLPELRRQPRADAMQPLILPPPPPPPWQPLQPAAMYLRWPSSATLAKSG